MQAALLLFVLAASPVALLADLAATVRAGDVHHMEQLKGTAFAARVRHVRVWRNGKAYRDLLVRAGDGPRAFEFLVRVSERTPTPAAGAEVDVDGTIADFEPVPLAGKLTWIARVQTAERR